jgi:hypothetical protein
MLPIHLLVESKIYIINNNKIDEDKDKPSKLILKEQEDKYIIPYIHSKICEFFNSSFANPLSPQGLLILGYIINVFLLKYKWKECIY